MLRRTLGLNITIEAVHTFIPLQGLMKMQLVLLQIDSDNR